jgi:hypothetical protein
VIVGRPEAMQDSVGEYHSVLAAIAAGTAHRGGIARSIRWTWSDLEHTRDATDLWRRSQMGRHDGYGDVDRLRRIRALLMAQGRHGSDTARLVCYSGAGFTEELTAAAHPDSGTVLVGLATLYLTLTP